MGPNWSCTIKNKKINIENIISCKFCLFSWQEEKKAGLTKGWAGKVKEEWLCITCRRHSVGSLLFIKLTFTGKWCLACKQSEYSVGEREGGAGNNSKKMAFSLASQTGSVETVYLWECYIDMSYKMVWELVVYSLTLKCLGPRTYTHTCPLKLLFPSLSAHPTFQPSLSQM